MTDADTTVPHDDQAFREARRKQLRMLPEPPEVEGLQCAVVYRPAEFVGGDFYDFVEMPGRRLGIVQGDVSGHGLRVWGDMTMAMKAMRIYARQADGAAQMLNQVNEDLVPDLTANTFITACFAILDLDTFVLRLARAGHNPVILFNPDRPEAITELSPQGMVLGMAKRDMFERALEEGELQLFSGDMLLIYTDGVTETMNAKQEEWGIERLLNLVAAHGRASAEGLCHAILNEIKAFRGEIPQDDDVTLIALKID